MPGSDDPVKISPGSAAVTLDGGQPVAVQGAVILPNPATVTLTGQYQVAVSVPGHPHDLTQPEFLDAFIGAHIKASAARNTKHATRRKEEKGKETRDRVVAMARTLKAANPRMSKVSVARDIAKGRAAPCGFDQAKAYLGKINQSDWRKFGSSER